MATHWTQSRQTKYTAYAGVYVVVILAVLGAVNFLANRYDKSFDSTKNKQYSLSDQTIKITKELKVPIKLTYFGDQGSFPSARDLLERYANQSTNVKVDYIDPVKKPQIARAAGFRADSPIVVENGAKKEGAKSLTEEEVTGALIRALKTGERNVCFMSGFGEHSIDQQDAAGLSLLKTLLERDNYKTRAVTLKPAAPEAGKTVEIGKAAPTGAVEVPADCTVLISAGPKVAYPQPVAAAMQTYVENGGRGIFMLDNPLRLGRTEPPADSPDLLKTLADWGVTVNKDLVLDLSGIGQIFGFGPEIPIVVQYEAHAITTPLTRVPTGFPLARSLDVKSAGKSSVEKLLSTGDDSVAVTDVPANGNIDPRKGKKGPLVLGAVGTISGTKQGRFIVIGTSEAAANNFTGARQLGNRDLLVNSVNWLSSDEDLISIRPKAPEDQALNITGPRMNLLFWLSVVIFPMGVVFFGLATWWKRR